VPRSPFHIFSFRKAPRVVPRLFLSLGVLEGPTCRDSLAWLGPSPLPFLKKFLGPHREPGDDFLYRSPSAQAGYLPFFSPSFVLILLCPKGKCTWTFSFFTGKNTFFSGSIDPVSHFFLLPCGPSNFPAFELFLPGSSFDLPRKELSVFFGSASPSLPVPITKLFPAVGGDGTVLLSTATVFFPFYHSSFLQS